MLADVILQNNGHATETVLPIPLGRIIPGMEHEKIRRIHPTARSQPRIIKTHEQHSRIGGVPHLLNAPKVLFLFRHPVATVRSYYRIYGDAIPDSYEAFCLRTIEDHWCPNLTSHIRAKRDLPERVCFISYESMLEDPLGTLQKALQFADLECDDQRCRIAVDHHRIEEHRATHFRGYPSNIVAESFMRVREASAAESLSAAPIAELEAIGLRLYDEARVLEAS